MKKIVSILLAVLLIVSCLFVATPMAYASKAQNKRAIAIVFDNSGSMYLDGEKAWCRATYAMEVFASMLNKGDTLQIYPMHMIEAGGKQYTMDNPLTITDPSQASVIRDIYSPEAKGTPIETITAAANGLKALTADSKYLIVLTDGDSFYRNNKDLTKSKTPKALDDCFKPLAGPEMMVMYLGVGKAVAMPTMAESEYFVKKKAADSADTLSILTDMCNNVFGRDTLPKTHITGKKIKLDMTISKLIVFVQGENVSDLKISGGKVGKTESVVATKYSTKGTGRCESVPDTKLQGMMGTYTDCSAGNYTISFKGNASKIEVYYEPDADLDFVFTDEEGNLVDPDELYEGNYKVSFGMKDAKTGQLIDSSLLGKPHYEGNYSINGKEYPFSHDGKSGEVPIKLKMNDTFDANLTVTYLSGYTISKNSTDFGWPKGGIKVAAKPAGHLKLKISGGDSVYSLENLKDGKPFKAEVYYQGKKLTGKELENVELTWNSDSSFALIKKELANDHYKLTLHHKDADAPADTVCGRCKVPITAQYAAPGSDKAKSTATISYKIRDDFAPVKVSLSAPDDYIVIKEIADSQAVIATITQNGKPLSAEDFKSVTLKVDCGGIKHTVTPNEKDSSFSIKLLPTEGIKPDNYTISVTAHYTDHIGRKTQTDDEISITLSNIPLWALWLIWLLIIAFIIWLIWTILHIKVLPKRVKQKTDECYMSITGKNVSTGTDFNAKLSRKQLSVKSQHNGDTAGISISNLKPDKESYLYKKQQKRSILADPKSVKSLGDVSRADINGVTFVYDKNEGKLVPEDPDQKPFKINNDANVSFDGNIEINGKTKKYHTEIPISFKKR